MIELTVLNYLNNSEDITSSVYMEVPATCPSAFYLMEKTSGSMENHIYHSTIVIQSYADTLYNASLMNETLKEVMLYGLISENDIVNVELNGDYNFTDAETKRYRYQAVFDITHY